MCNDTIPMHRDTAATLQLPVSDIRAYDRNPRSAENPEYERITGARYRPAAVRDPATG